MTAIIPAVQVNDPWPQIDRYGLFAVSDVIDLQVHGRGGGITYHTVTLDLPDGFDVACATTRMEFTDPCGDQVTGTPFTVMASMTSGTVGMPQSEIVSTLLTRLKAGEQTVVESIFCSGLNGASPSLVNNTPAATVVTAAASVVDGIGALEAWLYALYGPRGVLHVPLFLAARMQHLACMTYQAGVWRTALGTAVMFGNYTGYDKAGGAPAAGTTNLYITGSLTTWRTPDDQIEIPPFEGNVNLTTNQVAAFARREYVVTHNGLLGVCNVDIDGI